MRVAQVLPAYFEDSLAFMGGGDRYVYRLARALRPYCDVTFFTFGPRYRRETLDGVEHIVLPVRFRGNHDNPFPGSLEFLTNRFDIVHTYQLRSIVTSIATIVRRAARQPLIVTDLGGGGRSATYRLRFYRLIPAFICISEFSRSLLPASVRARAKVIHGGVEVDRFSYDPAPRRRQVLQVSRIMPHKGMNYLIEAAGDDIPVVIAGKIVNTEYYRALERAASGKRVNFLIDVSDDAIHAEYRRASITVAASVYRDMYGGSWPTSELLGLPLLESMAVGTPVVCTAVGGMPEFVQDGRTGFVIPPNDPIGLRQRLLELLDDAERISAMGLAGHEHVQQYSWDAVAQQVVAQYATQLGRT